MPKDKTQQQQQTDDGSRLAATAVDRATSARDDYFRELYEAWQETSQQTAAAQRAYQEQVAALSGSDEIAQAQKALQEAHRGYGVAVQLASTAPAPDSRDAIAAERDKYAAAAEAVTAAGRRVQEQLQREQQGFAQQSWAAQSALYDRYAESFRKYVAAHVDALNAAGSALDPALAYTLAQRLMAVASHAAWLQRANPAAQAGAAQRASAA